MVQKENLTLPIHPLQAVYGMPTSEDDEPSSSMPLALQSVFYKVWVAHFVLFCREYDGQEFVIQAVEILFLN